jgi:hypothetical protein
MRNNAKFVFILLVLLSIAMGLYESVLYINELELRDTLQGLWSFVFIVLLVLWIIEDSKNHSKIYRPFDFGFLVLLFYVAYVPYYLYKTRGFVIGSSLIFSLIILFNIGWLFTVLINLAS